MKDGSKEGSNAPNGPFRPKVPSTMLPTSKGKDGRRWNTPQDLHKLLFMIGPKKGKLNSELPVLVSKGEERERERERELGRLSIHSVGTTETRRSIESCSSDIDCLGNVTAIQTNQPPRNRFSVLRQDDVTPRYRKKSTAAQTLKRVSSTLTLGHGVASYSDIQLLMPFADCPQPVQMRITSTLLLFHSKEPPDLSGKEKEGRLFAKLQLISVSQAYLEGNGSLILSILRQKNDGIARPSRRKSSAVTDRYEVLSDDTELIDEIMMCILQQQVKAFHMELGRVRRSLKPVGGRTLDIVHYNDIYHLSVFKKNEEPCGGITRFAHQLEIIRRTKNPLVLFSGDFVGPSLMSVITKGKQMIDAMNFMGTHYGVFGNHEFDFGLRNLERIVHGYTQGEYIFAGSNTEWLMTNMDGKNGEPLADASRSKLIEWNGVSIGLIGLCENWLPHCPRLTKGEAIYRDMFEVGEREAKSLKEQGAELVIALTHNRLALDKQVTTLCPSVDLLLGGHDHTYKKDLPARIIKSGEEFQWLSEVTMTLDDSSSPHIACKTHAISGELPENKMIDKLVQRYDEKLREKMGKVIGKTNVPLDSTEESCRFREGVLTNFLTDLMASETGADCAVLGGAAVAGKGVIEPGNLTIGDIFNWFPHETKIQVVEMSGACLHEMLESSVKELPEEAPSFPHPSAELAFTINKLKSPVRVESISVKGEPLDLEQLYKVAVTDFVAAGKERFKALKSDFKVLTEAEHAEQYSMWIIEYFRQKKGQRAVGADLGKSVNLPSTPLTHFRCRKRGSSVAPHFEEVVAPTQPDSSADGFDIGDVDFEDVDNDTMRKVMIALSKLSEEVNVFQAQAFIKNSVKTLLNCDRAAIFLVDQLQQTLKFVPDGGSQEIAIPMSHGIAGLCATTGEVVHIPEAYKDKRFNQDVDKQTGYQTRDILACPVKRRGGRVVAVMQAVNKAESEGTFMEKDIHILKLFGKQTAIHLGNAEMFESLRKNQEATHTLLKVARDMASDISMDMKTMVACIMSGASQLLRCDRSSLFLVDSKNEEMWSIIYDNAGNETIIRLPLGTGVAGHTAVTGLTLNLKDAYDSDLFNPVWDKKNGYRTKQILCVPIFTTEGSSDVLGVLQFINKLDGTEFNPQDEATAEAFSSFAGISISNTQEIDLLKLKNDDQLVQEVPPVSLGRISVKGGWHTVRLAMKQPSILIGQPKASHNADRRESRLAMLTAKSMTGNPRCASVHALDRHNTGKTSRSGKSFTFRSSSFRPESKKKNSDASVYGSDAVSEDSRD